MLEQSEATPTFCCTQCSHVAVWPFQLDHHIERKHKNVHAAELFKTILEPEQYQCVCCDFKSHCKLGRYEHCICKHDARTRTIEENTERRQFTEQWKSYPCKIRGCKTRENSILCFIKHKDSCKPMPQFAIACVSFPTKAGRTLGRTRSASKATSSKACVSFPTKAGRTRSASKAASSNGKEPLDLDDGLQCIHCPYKMKTLSSLKKHMAKHAKANNIKKRFSCTKCSYSTNRKTDLNRHSLKKHAEVVCWFNCMRCSYQAKDKRTLKIHMATHAEEVTWYKCRQCPYLTKRKPNLKRHALMHASPDEITWFHCTECSYKAKQNLYLQRHILTHTQVLDEPDKVDWFSCTECSYRTEHGKNLKLHMLTHAADDEITWFSCPECSYKSKQKGTLKTHMLVHAAPTDDIEWFDCSDCSYRTKKKWHLKKHYLLKHATPEEFNDRFSCTRCSHQFEDRASLKEHMLTCRFSCTECPYRTKQKTNLQRHMRTHNDWVTCTKCCYRTRHEYNLEKHILTHDAEPSQIENESSGRLEVAGTEETGMDQEANKILEEQDSRLQESAQDGLALIQNSVNAMYEMLNDGSNIK